MAVESSQPSLAPRRSAVRSGLATGVSALAVSGSAAVAGAYLGHKFGRDAETDGFLAAYGVYLVVVLAAQAFRLVLVPDLTRAATEDRLTAEVVSYVAAFLAIAVPVCAVTIALSNQFGEALTGNLPERSATIAGDALVWVVPAAFLQLLAAVSASALAAAHSYVIAAVGYALGAIVGLSVFIALADAHGLIALAWGVFANGAIAFAVPLAALLRYGHLRGRRRGGIAIGPRLWKLVQASAVPLALQGLYIIALRGASGLGEGNQTSLTYAYLAAATLVAATASSLSLISSAPLTRRGVDTEGAAAHVVHAAWASLALIGAAAVIVVLMAGVSMRMLRLAAVGLARAALAVAAIVVAAFALPALVVPAAAAAAIGLALYLGALAVLRPRGLVESWHYVRALHQ